eukprot:s2550_g3.t1
MLPIKSKVAISIAEQSIATQSITATEAKVFFVREQLQQSFRSDEKRLRETLRAFCARTFPKWPTVPMGADALTEVLSKRKPKTRRGKKILKDREPKVTEDAKTALIIRGARTSNDMTTLLRELHLIRTPLAMLYMRKHEEHPFEDRINVTFASLDHIICPLIDCSKVEVLCKKFDHALFAFGSTSKKRPSRLILGRLFDGALLDMQEFNIEDYKSMQKFRGSSKETLAGSKPLMIFHGPSFDTDERMKRVKSLLIDFFGGAVADQAMRLSQILDVGMTDFIATSVKYYLLSKSNGKVVLDTAKAGSNSKSQEPKGQAKVAAVEENGNSDDPFARNQKELQEAASGHVDRFNDFMVKDVKDESKFFRADKLLEEVMETKLQTPGITDAQRHEYTTVRNQADAYSQKEMYCLEQNSNRLPFGVAQVGRSFRNEIAPRAGLTRQREFTQAEIEYFVNPKQKDHPKFASVESTGLILFHADAQLNAKDPVKMTVGEAVRSGLINNETLGYFIVKTWQFLEALIQAEDTHSKEYIRFRQHLPTEMAHYACDCWDAEIFGSYGWLECVGIADRSAFDLTAHANAAKCDLQYKETSYETRRRALCRQCKEVEQIR